MLVVSDSDSGTFEIEDVPPGEYQIRACGAGPRKVAVQAGERVGPIEFTVEPDPLFTLAGHVAGIPAERTRVFPDGGSGDFLLECLAAPAGKQEEARRASVDWRQDGALTIRVHAPPTGRWDVVLKGGFPSLPDVSNVIRDIDPVVSEQPAGLQFELGRGGSISGRVLTADGRTPLPWVRVEARPIRGDALLLMPRGDHPHQEAGPPEAHTDAEGNFSVGGLLSGQYNVSAAWDRQCFGYAPPVHVRLAEGEHRDDVNFRAPRDWP
jgi:hypothetical protein